MSDFSLAAEHLLNPESLTGAADVKMAPRSPGLYGWWVKKGALVLPEDSYQERDEHQLLYVGISPRRAASNGTIRKRLVQHAKTDASRSTLRLTLGILLSEELGITLGIHQDRLTFGPDGEPRVTEWLGENTRVAWVVDLEPWVVEQELLDRAKLPLNLAGRDDDFSRDISAKRTAARSAAKSR